MIYVFIVDTSASMNQVFSHGLSFLDCAKGGIESFFSAGLNDTIPQLLTELKNLQATDISNPGQAFNAAFDYLNAYRFQAGLETIGKGRYFASIESTVIMWFTDGGNFSFIDRQSNKCVVQNRLQISGLRTPGATSYMEPFRWDQKLHTFLLSPEGKLVHPEVAAMSNATHSEVYAIWTKDHMKRCIENCMGAQKPPHPDVFPQFASVTMSSVWVNMEEVADSSNPNPRKGFKLNIYPQNDQGHTFPLPESYAVTNLLNGPPLRSAIPTLTYTAHDAHYAIPHGFPYDRFNIEQGPFKELVSRSTAASMASKQPPCWTLFARNSGNSEGLGDPIGFLKVSAASRGSGVMMYIMPYNFPKLFKLIEQLNKNPSMKTTPPPQWTKSFRHYLTEIPPYYHGKLRTMMGRIGLEHLLPSSLVPNVQDWPIATWLNTVTDQCKVEFGKFVSSVVEKSKIKAETQRRIALQTANPTTIIATTTSSPPPLLTNAFDAPRSQILLELRLLQTHFTKSMHLGASHNASSNATSIKKLCRDQTALDLIHSVPISEMSNHHSKVYVAPLRDPFETDEEIAGKAKRDPFGNPWVTKKVGKSVPIVPSSPGVNASSPSPSAAASENGDESDDEISNEASLMAGGGSDQLADAAKVAADLSHAASHARRHLPRRRSVSVATRESSVAGSSVAGTGRSDWFVVDRVPKLVDCFPVLVLPPMDWEYEQVERGLVDVVGWVERVRREAREGQERREGVERREREEAKVVAWSAGVDAMGEGSLMRGEVVKSPLVSQTAMMGVEQEGFEMPRAVEDALKLASFETPSAQHESARVNNGMPAIPPVAPHVVGATTSDFDSVIEHAFQDRAQSLNGSSVSKTVKRSVSGHVMSSSSTTVAAGAGPEPKRVRLDPRLKVRSSSFSNGSGSSSQSGATGFSRERLNAPLRGAGAIAKPSNDKPREMKAVVAQQTPTLAQQQQMQQQQLNAFLANLQTEAPLPPPTVPPPARQSYQYAPLPPPSVPPPARQSYQFPPARGGASTTTSTPRKTLPPKCNLWTKYHMPRVPNTVAAGFLGPPRHPNNMVCLAYNVAQCKGGCGYEHACAVCAVMNGTVVPHSAAAVHVEYL
ncbi:Integrator complex subunit 6 [Podochytrium sp. JEL0797]|nr:Integrator complex subunit 6 [Podochytrium sp. JEL0797]